MSRAIDCLLETMIAKTLYLASPYGFYKHWTERLLPDFVDLFEELGIEVWEPFSRNSQMNFSQPGWAHKVAVADMKDVRDADAIFAIVNGTPPDEGVMVELGAAIALGKPTFLFRDDFRRCTDSEDYPLNLMLFAGLPAFEWENYFYTSIEEISNPEKALIRWLKSAN